MPRNHPRYAVIASWPQIGYGRKGETQRVMHPSYQHTARWTVRNMWFLKSRQETKDRSRYL